MASNVTPSIPGAPLLLLAIWWASWSVSILQTWTYSPQKRQVGSAFALTYRLLRRSCKLMGVFVISPLPSLLLEPAQTAGSLRSTDVTPLHRYYRPSRHPLAFPPTSRCSGYTASLCSADFAAGRGGLLQLLGASLPSCCRYYPAGVVRRIGQISTVHIAFTPSRGARPPGVNVFEATYAFTFVTARWLAHHPKDGFVDRLSGFSFLPPDYPSYRASDFCPGGVDSR